jgi:hypothetical protein
MRSLPRTSALILVLLSLLTCAAQQIKPGLEVHTTTGQTTFHMGERISLTLSLTGPNDRKYSIDAASYDRSGRLDIDTFAVTPASGWADPLAAYFSHGFFGGGLRGSDELSSKPVTFAVDLNEHIRFDELGTYTVIATSHRVGTASTPGGFPREPYLTLTSNPIELHIIPATPEWQKEKLRSINAALAVPQKLNQQSPERAAAIADLRYLASPTAIEELAANLRDDRFDMISPCGFGLTGLPGSMRNAALQAMDHQIDDPHFPVSDWFLHIMTGLEASPHESPEQLQANEPARRKTAWQSVLSGLPHKEGPARAVTAKTLLDAAPRGLANGDAQLASILASSFMDLPPDDQLRELQYNWDLLRTQPMLPTLQALLKSPPAKPIVNGGNFSSPRELHAIVLQRWLELDPEGAQRALLAQLGTEDPVLTETAIASLPGETLPQFEHLWAHAFLSSNSYEQQKVLAALLVRFGTGSAIPQIKADIDANMEGMACLTQAAALAYIVKFDPDGARGLLHRGLTPPHPEKTGCHQSLFQEVSAYVHTPILNELALETIDNPDPNMAYDAAMYLIAFATEAAKKPLLDRYLQWSEVWAGKAEQLDSPGSDAGYREQNLGQALAEAVISNQGWLADPALVAEVLRRCVGKQMCDQVQQKAAQAISSIHNVSVYRSLFDEHYAIAQYSTKSMDLFEAKIAQFPKGTKFILTPMSPQNQDQKKLEREAEALFTKHGMTLETPAPPSRQEASN